MVEPGHAAVRFTNPTSGADVLPTMRLEMHRLRAGAQTAERREVGSAVWQVFSGTATVTVSGTTWTLTDGDLFVVPSWAPVTVGAEQETTLFRFADTPIYERLHLHRATTTATATATATATREETR